jgi:hypothetical protein
VIVGRYGVTKGALCVLCNMPYNLGLVSEKSTKAIAELATKELDMEVGSGASSLKPHELGISPQQDLTALKNFRAVVGAALAKCESQIADPKKRKRHSREADLVTLKELVQGMPDLLAIVQEYEDKVTSPVEVETYVYEALAIPQTRGVLTRAERRRQEEGDAAAPDV